MAVFSILNDVMGPVMRGPSSSHTAGAFRIGRIAGLLVNEPPACVRVAFDPGGSYAPTYHAMGLDAAFAAAFLGFEMEDERYAQAPALAAAQGLDLAFVIAPLEHHDHPNTIRLEITARSGSTHVLWGRSIGGGMVEVYRFDDWACCIDGKSWVLLLKMTGAANCRQRVAEQLGGKATPLPRPPSRGGEGAGGGQDEHDGTSFAQWNLLEPIPPEVLQRLQSMSEVADVRYLKPLMYVPRGAALFSSSREMLALAAGRHWSLGQTACAYEAALLGVAEQDVVAEVLRRFEIMRSAVAQGLDDSRVHMPLLSPSAASLWRAEQAGRLAHGGMLARAVARSLAVLHVCNSKGVVCAAPTGGSSGVLPGVLVTLSEERKAGAQQIAMAFLAAGAVGLVMAQRATFAAEEAGCQVEIGIAGAMAAAAVVEIAGGSAASAADAAAIALQNTMGLVCDPVDGGCEIPCHTRTAAAVAQAFVCGDLVLGGYANPISLDDAVDASYAVGKQLPPALRCTAQGGVAATPSAKAFVARRRRDSGDTIPISKQPEIGSCPRNPREGSMTQTLRFLSKEDIARVLTVKDAIPLVREAFVQLSSRQASVPLRTRIDVPGRDGTVLYMPAYFPAREILAVKVVSLFRNNPAAGLPLIHALVLVNDARTGRPSAVLDGEALTAIRTAAAAGLATELLARREAKVAAIFGAGVQGRAQLEAVCAVRPIAQAYIFDPDSRRAAAFCREMGEKLSLAVVAGGSPAQLRNADVICTVTTSATPVFAHQDVKPGAHINAFGSYKPGEREIPEATVRAAKVVVDERAACLAEAGDIIIPLQQGLITPEHIHAEIGEIAAGRKTGRCNDTEITLFKSVGNAIQDAAVASQALERAAALGLGSEVRG